jgi:methionine-rich copper-binding protein CopC
MSFLGENRIRIAEYFDDLKAKLDVCVETCIAANHQDQETVARINKVRSEWLKEIDECEKFNLAKLEEREDKSLKLEDEDLFKKIVFEFELPEGKEVVDLRIISIDTHMTPGKIECFKIAMKVANKEIEFSDFQKNCLEKLYVKSIKQNRNVKRNRFLKITKKISFSIPFRSN